MRRVDSGAVRCGLRRAADTLSGSCPERTTPIALSSREEKLERAKGFEPSTPTLARSCSTPELHPHPWERRPTVTGDRQSYAKCGQRMQQPATGNRKWHKSPISLSFWRNWPEIVATSLPNQPRRGTSPIETPSIHVTIGAILQTSPARSRKVRRVERARNRNWPTIQQGRNCHR